MEYHNLVHTKMSKRKATIGIIITKLHWSNGNDSLFLIIMALIVHDHVNGTKSEISNQHCTGATTADTTMNML